MNIMEQYIIITPCKNEENDLPNLIQSLIKQSITPKLWVIVDDGSTDNTPGIISDIKNKYRWVESIRLKEYRRDITIHFSSVMKSGFDFAMNYCKEHNVNCDYIVFLDADMVIRDTEFFEKLMLEFEKDEDLGIASGRIQTEDGSGNLHDSKGRIDTISGGEMMCRRQCIEDVGGVPISYAPDSVMRAKAILNGWKIKRIDGLKIIQARVTGSAEGLKKGYYIRGTAENYLNSNPFIVVIKGLKYCFQKPYFIGIVYLYGYFSSWILRKEKTKDEEIRKYFYWHKPREIVKYYFKKIRL